METLHQELDGMTTYWLKMPRGQNEIDFLKRICMVADLTELTIPMIQTEGWSLDMKLGRCCAR